MHIKSLIVFAIASLLAFSCGDDDNGLEQGGDGGTDIDGDSDTTQNCRNVLTSAKAIVDFGVPVNATVTGTYDPATHSLTFVITEDETQTEMFTMVQRYNTSLDFVAEGKVMGKRTHTREEVVGEFWYDYTYNADGTLAGWTKDNGEVQTFTEWDLQGRPIAGLWNLRTECTGAPVTIVYDDVARTETVQRNMSAGTGTGCPGSDLTTLQTRSQDNYVIKYEEGEDGILDTKIAYSELQSTPYCAE